MTPDHIDLLESRGDANLPPTTIEHRVMVLTVVARLNQLNITPDSDIADDHSRLYDILSPQYKDAGLSLSHAAITDALLLLRTPSAPRWQHLTVWVQRLALLVLTRRQWWPRYRVAILSSVVALLTAGITALAVGHFRYQSWVDRISATAQSTQEMRQSVELVAQEAGSLGSDPAGVHVHAAAALQAVGAASSSLNRMHVWSDGPNALRQAYEAQSGSVVKTIEQDRATLATTQTDLQRAKSELDLAQIVQQASQSWQDLGMPPSLPAALMQVWDHDVALMRSALASGDVNAIAHADALLRVAQTSGPDIALAKQLVQSLPDAAQPEAQQLADHVNDLVAAGDARGIQGVLNQLRVMHSQVPLAYDLKVASGNGLESGVIREMDNSAATRAHYLIVQATDGAGHPIEVPVIDSETHAVSTKTTFGVEVSAAVYNEFKAKKQQGIEGDLVATKSPGEVRPTFRIPVLGRTLTRW